MDAVQKREKMGQKVFDSGRNGFYRDTVRDFDIVFKDKQTFMGSSHYHPYFEICCVKNGQCRIFVEHKLFVVREGEIVILPPSILHRNQYEQKSPAERINLSFTREFIEPVLNCIMPDFLEKVMVLGKSGFCGSERERFFGLLDLLLRERQKGDFYGEMKVYGLLLSLFSMIGENCLNAKNGKNGENAESSENVWKEEPLDPAVADVQEAAKFIFENYADRITLEKAAEVAGMCPTYFSRKFSEVTGYGFKEYLTNVRLKHSQEMLVSGTLTVTQIAFACGFGDANYFGDAFRKHTGCSPREFRKKWKK